VKVSDWPSTIACPIRPIRNFLSSRIKRDAHSAAHDCEEQDEVFHLLPLPMSDSQGALYGAATE
jgi:hypothetical protein